MKTIAIYRHFNKGLKAVKLGFSWPGFFFMWIWAFSKGLNGIGTVLLFFWLAIQGLYVFAVMSALDFTDIIYSFISLGTAIFVGCYGNKWQANSLVKRGYKLVNIVEDRSLTAAILKKKNLQ